MFLDTSDTPHLAVRGELITEMSENTATETHKAYGVLKYDKHKQRTGYQEHVVMGHDTKSRFIVAVQTGRHIVNPDVWYALLTTKVFIAHQEQYFLE